LKTAWNEDTKDEVLSAWDEGDGIGDIIDDVGIENIFKFNPRLRYRYSTGNKIYFGDMMKGNVHTPYLGIIWIPRARK
jgi:hypothetical protein